MPVVALGATVFFAPAADAATFTVTNLDPSGPGSLAQAVSDAEAASDADTIEFQPGLSGTVTLAGELAISNPVTIHGPGADDGDARRPRSEPGLRLRDDRALRGHRPHARERFRRGDGGAIFADNAEITLRNLVVRDSASTGQGGGVLINTDPNLPVEVTGSIFDHNSSSRYGGGLTLNSTNGPVTPPAAEALIEGNTFTDNSATGPGGGAMAFYDETSVGRRPQ